MAGIGSALAEHPQIPLVALGLFVLLIAGLIAFRPRPFPPSLTIDELNGFARLNLVDPGRGVEALSTFYGWRQEQWSVLARGLGALAVAIVLALVGATLEAGKTVTEESGNAADPEESTITTTESETSPAMLGLAGGLLVAAGAAWLRSRALHREFSGDLGRLTNP